MYLIEAIRLAEFVVTCLILFSVAYTLRRAWVSHALKEATKRRALEEREQRRLSGAHGHAATMKRKHYE